MTRRYKPTTISASHEDARQADMFRERAKPAAPEPAAAAKPAPTPKPTRPKVVVVRMPPPDGTVVMQPEEASAIRRMLNQAIDTTTEPAVRNRLRAARTTFHDATTGHL